MNFNSYHDISLLSRFFLLISKVLIRNKLNYQESFVYYCQRFTINYFSWFFLVFWNNSKSPSIKRILVRIWLKVPSLARSVPNPLKVPSLARSVPKPLKVPSLARSVPKPLKLAFPGRTGVSLLRRYYYLNLLFVRFVLPLYGSMRSSRPLLTSSLCNGCSNRQLLWKARLLPFSLKGKKTFSFICITG